MLFKSQFVSGYGHMSNNKINDKIKSCNAERDIVAIFDDSLQNGMVITKKIFLNF